MGIIQVLILDSTLIQMCDLANKKKVVSVSDCSMCVNVCNSAKASAEGKHNENRL